MATRIVERELTWCQSRILDALASVGYCLDAPGTVAELLKGTYTKADAGRMLYEPTIVVGTKPISANLTQVTIWFPARWGRMAASFSLWVLIALVPFFAGLALVSLHLEGEGLVTWALRSAATLILSVGLTSLIIYRRCHVPGKALEQHWVKTEQLLWEALDPDGSVSHEVVGESPAYVGFWTGIKRVSLCATVVGGLLLTGSLLLSVVDSLVGHEGNFVASLMSSLCRSYAPGTLGRWSGLVLLGGGAASLAVSGMMTCSWELPHRFHWKVRFYGIYLLWWMVLCLPGLMLVVHAMDRMVVSPVVEEVGTALRPVFVVVVLVLQYLNMAVLLRLFPECRDPEGYYLPPSTRYEALSERSNHGEIRHLLRRHRFWLWTNLVFFSTLCYFAAAYLVAVLVEATAGVLGARWALDCSSRWPVLVPVDGRGAAIQALFLVCLMGSPLGLAVTQAVRGRARLWRRSMRGDALAERWEHLDLPAEPMDSLRNGLQAASLHVMLVPTPSISMQIERAAVFARNYVLWISVGAHTTLSPEEMEALLWHECGHADHLRRGCWREIAALLVPWVGRFADLAEDLYEWERQADLHAAQRMGTAKPLLSALRKLEEQRGLSDKGRAATEHSRQRGWVSLEALKVMWSLGWLGYVYPDVGQRIAWLTEWQARRGEGFDG